MTVIHRPLHYLDSEETISVKESGAAAESSSNSTANLERRSYA